MVELFFILLLLIFFCAVSQQAIIRKYGDERETEWNGTSYDSHRRKIEDEIEAAVLYHKFWCHFAFARLLPNRRKKNEIFSDSYNEER